MVMLGFHGGDLYGFTLVRGDADALGRLSASDEFNWHMTRANQALYNVGVVPASTGDEVEQIVAGFEQFLNEMDR